MNDDVSEPQSPPHVRFYRYIFSKDFWNPRHKKGGYVAPHITSVGIIALVAFLVLSALTVKAVYDSGYWQSHYRFNGVKVPSPRASAPIQDIRQPGIPAQVSIQMSRYPAVANQGTLGACAAYASAWALSYEYRIAHNTWTRVSPRYLYDVYSDKYSGGQDAGSWPDQLLENSGTTGTPRYKTFFSPPFVIDNPAPIFPTGNLVIPLQIHAISGFAQGAGQGAVDGIRSALYGTNGSNGHPVLIAFPVYPEYDNATQQPLVVSPTAGESSRGGHENVVLAEDATKAMPDGTVGAVLVQNNWTKAWGASGRAWLSEDFIRRYSFGLEYITPGAAAPHAGKVPTFRANPKAHLYKPPYDPGVRVGTGTTTAWYVHNVHLYNRSSGENISGIINALGDQFHVWPVAIAAVIGTESAFNPLAELWNGGIDNSCGLMQQILQNVYMRIGFVSARAACNWEEVPFNSINFGTDILHQADAYHNGRVPWPNQYVFYNAGMGVSDSFAMYPTGQAYSNLVNNFDPWYRYSLVNFAGGLPVPPPPPVKKAFPQARWGHAVSPYYRKHLSWAASVWLRHQRLGKATGSHWQPTVVLYPSFKVIVKGTYTKTTFQYGAIYTWPRFHKAKVVTWRKR